MNDSRKKITIVIPCYNEAAAIGVLLKTIQKGRSLQERYILDVMVIDNNSTDDTSKIAKELGARVVFEKKKGKGEAIQYGLRQIPDDTDFVVMMDGDNTYHPNEVQRMIEPIESGFCDAVLGSRMQGKVHAGAMNFTSRTGNWIFSFLVRAFYGQNVTDVLTGYFAWSKPALDKMLPHLKSSGFEIEMEMITKMARLGIDAYSVPISYHGRIGESKLDALKDGHVIMKMFLSNLSWRPKFNRRRPAISFVSDAIYPYNKGGKETRLFQITTRLAQKGYNVRIFTMQWWKGPRNRRENGVRLHAISPYYPLYDGPRRSIKQGVMFGLHCLRLIRYDFDSIDVDHMPFFPVFSVRLVAWIKSKRMLGTWHEVWGRQYWQQYLGPVKGSIAAFIEWLAVFLPDSILSVSALTTQRLKEYTSSKVITTIPNGIDLEFIRSAPVSKKKSDLIFVGRLLKHKNIDVLLESVAEIKKTQPNILCRIIGTGPEKKRLITIAQNLKLSNNVTFHGRIEDDTEVFSMMKASKMFVLPSTREGFGIVVLEAYACGLPVVTVKHPDNAALELVSAKSGRVAELNVSSLTESIDYLLKHKTEVADVDLNKYDWNSVILTVENIIKQKM